MSEKEKETSVVKLTTKNLYYKGWGIEK